MQVELFSEDIVLPRIIPPFKTQLLKWVGNKQRFAHEIASCFPSEFGTYYEPFLGSGAVLATLAPDKAVASDRFGPLIDIFQCLHDDPEQLVEWYRQRWQLAQDLGKKEAYSKIRDAYNRAPNGADFLFLTRSCYGGVVRFRKQDGYMSTPCGAHDPIHPDNFASRVKIWAERTANAEFRNCDYSDILAQAQPGDLIYCDPPYVHSQAILYGGQSFSFEHLISMIADCKKRGVYVALSIDGTKKSGSVECALPIPDDLFEREIFVNCGRSMLRRFQMEGQQLQAEEVTDRLLLTY